MPLITKSNSWDHAYMLDLKLQHVKGGNTTVRSVPRECNYLLRRLKDRGAAVLDATGFDGKLSNFSVTIVVEDASVAQVLLHDTHGCLLEFVDLSAFHSSEFPHVFKIILKPGYEEHLLKCGSFEQVSISWMRLIAQVMDHQYGHMMGYGDKPVDASKLGGLL